MNIMKYLKRDKKPKTPELKLDSQGRVSYFDIKKVDVEKYLTPVDKKIARILYDEYDLPYKVDTVLTGIRDKHGIDPRVSLKSIEKLHKFLIVSMRNNHVFVEGGSRNERIIKK